MKFFNKGFLLTIIIFNLISCRNGKISSPTNETLFQVQSLENGLRRYSVSDYHPDSSTFYAHKIDSLLHTFTVIDSNKLNLYPLLINVYLMERQHKKAEVLTFELNEFEKYISPPSNNEKSLALANKAYLIFRDNKFTEAFKLLEKAIQLAEKSLNSKSYQFALRTWMLIAAKQDNQEAFEKYIPKFTQIINEADTLYYNLSRVYAEYYSLKKGSENEALYWLDKAILFLNTQQQNDAINSTLHFLLASVYDRIGDYDKVIQTYFDDLFSGEKYDLNKLLNYQKGDVPYGYISITEIAEALLNKYKKQKNLNDLILSERLIVKADSILSNQSILLNENRNLTFLLHSDQLLDVALQIMCEKYQLEKDPVLLNLLITIIQKNRTFIHKKEKALKTMLNNDNYSRYIKLQNKISKSNISITEDSPSLRKDIIELDKLEKQLSDYSNSLGEKSYITHPSYRLNNIQKLLSKRNSTLIIYNEINDTLIFRMNISPEDCQLKMIDLNKGYADELVRISYDPLLKSDSSNINAINHLLPKTSTSDLLIMNDGITGEINFHKIIQPLHKIDNITLLIDFDSLEKLFTKQDSIPIKRMAVFAFSDSETIGTRHTFSAWEIPYTYREAQALSDKYPSKVDIFSGLNATINQFLKTCRDTTYSHLHLALHGHSSGATREDIMLFFRNSTYGIDTLYGYEIPPNLHARSVVLSACDSNKGLYAPGEGKYSLARYFLRNGIHEVKASHGILKDRLYFFNNTITY